MGGVDRDCLLDFDAQVHDLISIHFDKKKQDHNTPNYNYARYNF